MSYIHHFHTVDDSLFYMVSSPSKSKKKAEKTLFNKLKRDEGIEIARGSMEILRNHSCKKIPARSRVILISTRPEEISHF